MGFERRGGVLHAEGVSLAEIAARFETPSYVYSRRAIETAWRAFDRAFAERDHLICYAVKANSNLAVLNCLARLGSGFDIVSRGELERVLAAGGDPQKTVFSGVAKTASDMARALEAGILAFNVESESELERLSAVAVERGDIAPVSLRINPDVDADTHPYIATGLRGNKFGVAIDDAHRIYRRAATLPGIEVTGVDFHIGSQLSSAAPVVDALDRALALVDGLAADGIPIGHIDIGGGVGIPYRDEDPTLDIADYAADLMARLRDYPQRILLEPGRRVVGNAGILLARVEYLKHGTDKSFAVTDAGMNDLLRPALYDAWQAIEPVTARTDRPASRYDVVGPVCETACFLGHDRELALAEGDLLAVHSAGAYGFTMASNYNSRPRPPELLVADDQVHVAREREAWATLWSGEHIPGA
jgi:diaminopimelate decarboxylase